MTEIALARPAPAYHAGRWFPKRPPEWLWWISLPLQAIPVLLLTNFSFFWVDDFLLLGQARTQPFSLGYLRENLFGHFSPDLRALDSLLIAINSGSWVVARIVSAIMFTATVAGAMFVVRWILGRSWTAFSFVLVFGQSLFLVRVLGWWSSQTAIMLNSTFMLFALGCALRWFDRRGGWWLAGTLVAFVLALCDYELAMIFPVYLILIRLLIMEDELSPRHLWSVVWSERWLWLSLLVLDLLALLNFFAGHYYYTTPSPTLWQLLRFLFDTAFDAFIPAQFGYSHMPAQPGPLALLLTIGPFLAALGVTLVVRPRAWRALVALVISFALAMIPLGLNRIWAVGVTVGEEPFYEESAAFVLLVFTSFAVSSRWGGRRVGARRPRWLTPPRVVAAGLLALALYGTAYVISARRLGAATPIPARTKKFVTTYVASSDAVTRRLGHHPAVLDREVPTTIMPASYEPFSDAAVFFGMFRARAEFNKWASPLYAIGDDGALYPVRTRTVARAQLPGTQVVPGPNTGVNATRSGVCSRSDVALSVRVALDSVVPRRLSRPGESLAIGMRYGAPHAEPVPAVALLRNGTPIALGTQELQAGTGAILYPLPPVPGGRPIAFQFVLAPGMCLAGATMLAVSPASG